MKAQATYYLDANAHVPINQRVLSKQVEFQKTIAAHGHPSSPSYPGRAASAAIEESRAKIAKLIGAESSKNIIFTNSCTQACEWGMKLLHSHYLFISPIEHPAVQQACEKAVGNIYSKLEVNSDGIVSIPKEMNENYAISCIHLHNELGTIQDIKQFRSKYPKNLIFSDISQSLGKIPVNVQDLGIDIGVAGAHKFGGPSGVGFLYLKDLDLWKQFGSGSRYYMDIPGTPNTSGIVDTANALEDAISTLDERYDNSVKFRDVFESGLKDLGFEIIAEKSNRSPNTTFVRTPANSLLLLLELGKRKIHCGLGSACGSLYSSGSPLMATLGLPSDGQEYMRFSQWGEYNNNDAKYVIEQIKDVLKTIT